MLISEPPVRRTWSAQGIYRALTLAVGALVLLMASNDLGLFGDLTQREPLYTIFIVLMFGAAFAGIGLAILALIGSFLLARNWRLALPAWLYTIAAGLVCVDLFVFAAKANLWLPATMVACASFLAAVWAGWFLKG